MEKLKISAETGDHIDNGGEVELAHGDLSWRTSVNSSDSLATLRRNPKSAGAERPADEGVSRALSR